jgi:hypothetical protein
MFVSHHEFMYGKKPGESNKKVISTSSKSDFPTLSDGLGIAVQDKPEPKA